MVKRKCYMGLRYRVVFYLCGFLFASTSYILGVLAFGIESASYDGGRFYNDLVKNLIDSYQTHVTTFYLWQIVCVSVAGIIGHYFDEQVAHRKAAELRANIDGVTEVFNHRFFQETLVTEIERASRYGRNVSLIMFDLDNFKRFNDTWGHQEGDKLLKWFAGVCGTCVPNVDCLARYGGRNS